MHSFVNMTQTGIAPYNLSPYVLTRYIPQPNQASVARLVLVKQYTHYTLDNLDTHHTLDNLDILYTIYNLVTHHTILDNLDTDMQYRWRQAFLCPVLWLASLIHGC